MVLAALFRVDALWSEAGHLQAVHNYAWDGAAIALVRGEGLKVFPVPPHYASGKALSPADYLQDDWVDAVSTVTLPDYNFGLGVPVVRAVLYSVFGFTDLPYRILQAAVTCFLLPLVYFAARVFSGRRAVAFMAAGAYAISLFEPKMSLYLSREIYVLAGLVLILFASAYALAFGNRRTLRAAVILFMCGAGVALTAFFRTLTLPMVIGVIVTCIVVLPWRRAAILVTAFTVGVLVVTAPVAFWNKTRIGMYVLSQENGFSSLWMAVGLGENPVGVAPTDFALYASTEGEIERSGAEIPKGFRPPLQKLSCDRIQPGTSPRFECGPWSMHTLANPYYWGHSNLYEMAALDLWRQYLHMFPNHFLRRYLTNVWTNTTSFNRYAVASPPFWRMLTPELKWMSRILRIEDGTYQSLWLAFLAFVPWLAFSGTLLAVLQRPCLLLMLVPVAPFIGELSFAVGGTARFNYPVLVVYYVFSAYALAWVATHLSRMQILHLSMGHRR
jgi:4-amino-4-deoxy-L-arabinose transferase-like glycosyltransferase